MIVRYEIFDPQNARGHFLLAAGAMATRSLSGILLYVQAQNPIDAKPQTLDSKPKILLKA